MSDEVLNYFFITLRLLAEMMLYGDEPEWAEGTSAAIGFTHNVTPHART
jgi:hypothetical protein